MIHGKKDGMQSNADKFESTRNVIRVKGELFEQNVVEMDFFTLKTSKTTTAETYTQTPYRASRRTRVIAYEAKNCTNAT